MKLTPGVDKVDGCGVEGCKLLQNNLESVDDQSWKIWYGMVRLFKVRLGGSNSWPFGRESFASPLDQCKGLSVFILGGMGCQGLSYDKNSYSNPYESFGVRIFGHYSRRILGFTFLQISATLIKNIYSRSGFFLTTSKFSAFKFSMMRRPSSSDA